MTLPTRPADRRATWAEVLDRVEFPPVAVRGIKAVRAVVMVPRQRHLFQVVLTGRSVRRLSNFLDRRQQQPD